MSKYIKAAISDMSDEPIEVRLELARNSNTPAATLETLANDPSEDVRQAVAYNPNTSKESLKKLAEDDSVSVRYTVANNPNTPIDTLVQFAKDSSSTIRANVAANYNTPIDVLRALGEDPNWDVREMVAANPNTPWDLLVILGQDSVLSVRMHARVRYNVEVRFAGMIGASEFIEVWVRPEPTEDYLHDVLLDYYESELMDLLDVGETEYLGDGDWEVTLNFNGYIGCDETYSVYADDEDEAIDQALHEAIFDFDILSFEYLGR